MSKRKELRWFVRSIRTFYKKNQFLYTQEIITKIEEVSKKFAITINTSESPIFIFAIGWRSGSTLLQRIIMTNPDVLIWGEPYGSLDIIRTFIRFILPIGGNWPPERYFLYNSVDLMATKWIANLYPEPKDLIEGIRKFLLELFATPVYRLGYKRWGVKEVRLGAPEAFFLKWLFPRAKFLVMIRNPVNQYSSFKGWEPWVEWQSLKVDNVVSFARYWNYLAMSWLHLPDGFPFMMVKYEDLVARNVNFSEIEDFLSLKLTPHKALNVKVGKRKKKKIVRNYERWIINRETKTARKHYGY